MGAGQPIYEETAFSHARGDTSGFGRLAIIRSAMFRICVNTRADDPEHISHLVRRSGVKSSKMARLPKGLKSAPLYGSVGDVWLEHQDAADPRKVLNRLKNQRKFPWKTLAFDGQVRPPYSGKLHSFPLLSRRVWGLRLRHIHQEVGRGRSSNPFRPGSYV